MKSSSWLRPEIIVGGRRWPVWRLTVLSGSLLGIFLASLLAALSGASPWVAGSAAFFSALCALGLAMARKVFYGYESYTFYDYHLAVLAAATVFLYAFRQPLLAYLDLVALALAAALSVGRIGCLMSGCCHGRPHHWGVCYRLEHAEAGFPTYLVGIRLFPIQAVESAWVFLILAVGSLLVINGAPAGAALAWYVAAYGLGRFTLEFFRGDPDRPYHRGYSKAQWMSMLLVFGVAGAGLAGWLPLSWLLVGGAALLVLMLLGVTARRRMDEAARHDLLSPRHVKEIAGAIRIRPAARPADIRVACTSQGICLSASTAGTGTQLTHLYTLSANRKVMKREAAEILAGIIVQLHGHRSPGTLIEGKDGLFHLLVTQTGPQTSNPKEEIFHPQAGRPRFIQLEQ